MYQTKNLGLNITEIDKDVLQPFNFDIDLGNNFKAIDEKTLSHRNITNCLLEVPQDIKLELVDGVLTLKEGSKVYIPNGFEADGVTKKFEEFVIVSDLTLQQNSTSDAKLLLISDKTRLMTASFSSLTVSELPSSPAFYTLYYNTTTNKCSYYASESWIHDIAFPIGIATRSTNGFSSIDQVFNGFGYIGSTMFALPGVKCLIPNGRNEDGSLNNIEHYVNAVLPYNLGGGFEDKQAPLVLTPSHFGYFSSVNTIFNVNKPSEPTEYTRWFDVKNNFWLEYTSESGWVKQQYSIVGALNIMDKVINSLKIKTPFHAVDYFDYQTKITELETKIATLQAAVEALQG